MVKYICLAGVMSQYTPASVERDPEADSSMNQILDTVERRSRELLSV